jgi:hypothetical protein
MADVATPWYLIRDDEEQLHERAYDFAKRLRDRQYETRRYRAEHALFLYLGSVRVGLSGGSMPAEFWDESIPFYNLVQAVTDWFTSMMVRNQVRPYVLTERGDAKLQGKAKAMMCATEGVMRAAGVWDTLGMLRCQDGHLFEGGGIKWAADIQNKRIVASRVRAWDWWSPEREARLGDPRQGVHGQLIERGVLAAMFEPGSPEHTLVMECEAEPVDVQESIVGEVSDMLLVFELWHLPSGKPDLSEDRAFGLDEKEKDPGHDGRHVMVLKDGLLLDEPWPYDYFPISWYRPWRDPVGMWSRSVPETLAGTQLKLIEIGEKIDSIMRLHSVPHLLIWENAKINTGMWTNENAAIMKTRVPPQQAAHYLTPQAVPAELFQREEWLIRKGKEQIGISDMQLFGEKPPGIDHAPGMEHLSEETMVRHTRPHKEWEGAHLQDSKIIIDLMRLLARNGVEMAYVFGESKDLLHYNWADMDMDREKFHLKTWPTSLFAQTPTARFRQAEQFVKGGFLNGTPQSRMALKILQFPDVEELTGDLIAEEENIDRTLDRVVEGANDEDTIPHPYLDLALAKMKCKERINRLEANGDDPDTIDRLRDWWLACDKVEKQEQARNAALNGAPGGTVSAIQALPGSAPPGAPPMAPPMAPPQQGVA